MNIDSKDHISDLEKLRLIAKTAVSESKESAQLVLKLTHQNELLVKKIESFDSTIRDIYSKLRLENTNAQNIVKQSLEIDRLYEDNSKALASISKIGLQINRMFDRFSDFENSHAQTVKDVNNLEYILSNQQERADFTNSKLFALQKSFVFELEDTLASISDQQKSHASSIEQLTTSGVESKVKINLACRNINHMIETFQQLVESNEHLQVPSHNLDNHLIDLSSTVITPFPISVSGSKSKKIIKPNSSPKNPSSHTDNRTNDNHILFDSHNIGLKPLESVCIENYNFRDITTPSSTVSTDTGLLYNDTPKPNPTRLPKPEKETTITTNNIKVKSKKVHVLQGEKDLKNKRKNHVMESLREIYGGDGYKSSYSKSEIGSAYPPNNLLNDHELYKRQLHLGNQQIKSSIVDSQTHDSSAYSSPKGRKNTSFSSQNVSNGETKYENIKSIKQHSNSITQISSSVLSPTRNIISYVHNNQSRNGWTTSSERITHSSISKRPLYSHLVNSLLLSSDSVGIRFSKPVANSSNLRDNFSSNQFS
ncbi:hypothetical protein BB560_006454 [Smittium megazygosporum]|uniref:Uncharacterized protein n=1 Tax=Smittium megazygosporum TaxID=133381 RepID=A0A2T9Y5Q0_9FUNG|nr:hypothetical protein BB560_006454 [Smittium megazygosporum]